ncbi:hypothetical protein C8A05DRAFT_38171 [Staphylotrichum tortipilum]|uniref:Uncharacterized protein n=1 Tax=Staphylotrichum tortipilum TaxID=2831512 RepID=A0AAN6MCI5_9PEZI|nr:hypothetical protein C8A05DRAFT_38171 [Staphylotrichum longicolle]
MPPPTNSSHCSFLFSNAAPARQNLSFLFSNAAAAAAAAAAPAYARSDDRRSNRYPWRAACNLLPYASPARPPAAAAGLDMYTAHIGELCRLLDVRSSFTRLDLSDAIARSAIAMHVKLDAVNALPCAYYAGPSPTGPFTSCIAMTEFDGACMNYVCMLSYFRST